MKTNPCTWHVADDCLSLVVDQMSVPDGSSTIGVPACTIDVSRFALGWNYLYCYLDVNGVPFVEPHPAPPHEWSEDCRRWYLGAIFSRGDKLIWATRDRSRAMTVEERLAEVERERDEARRETCQLAAIHGWTIDTETPLVAREHMSAKSRWGDKEADRLFPPDDEAGRRKDPPHV